MRIIVAKTKLADKHVKWEEAYTPKTERLKVMFEEIIGHGSYFRFEGKSPEGDEYYCILSPAKIHNPIAKFFAGVRKLPATYAAGGKYFDSMDRAAAYAKETWGVDTPASLKPYTSKQLSGLSAKADRWRDENDNTPIISKEDAVDDGD